MHDYDAPRPTVGDFLLLNRDRVRAQEWPRRWQAIHPTSQLVAHSASSPTEAESLARLAEARVLAASRETVRTGGP